MNIREVIEAAAAKGKDKTYLFFEDQEVSFQDFDAKVNQVSDGLMGLGVKHGDKIALMLPNCPEFLYAWFGANKLGAIMVPVNTAFKAEETKYIVSHSEAKVVVTHPTFLQMLKTICRDCKAVQSIVCMGDLSDSDVIPFSAISNGSPVLAPVNIDDEDVAAYVYTSGTTGFPKGVMLPHRAYVNTGQAFGLWFNLTPEDRVINHNPLFHGNAQFYATMGSLCAAIPLILVEKFSASRFWDETRRYKATIATPFGAPLLMKQPPSDRDKDHPVRAFFFNMPTAFRQRFNVEVRGGFSMTETMIGAFCDVPALEKERGGPLDDVRCIGRGAPHPDPAKNTQIKVVDANDNELPVGQIGELVVKGPALMKGYFKQPEETVKALRGGWMHTGDAAWLGEDGCYYFFGRRKDIIRVSGENVSPAEVEAVINTHPKVQESACIPVPSPVRGEEIKAYVVLKPGETLAPEEIVDWCRERIAYFKVPRYVEFRDVPLPKTAATMRIQKHILKAEKPNLTEGCYDRGERPAWYHA
ncbi:MAG: AMP-binding protein [Terriglobales bacterium]